MAEKVEYEDGIQYLNGDFKQAILNATNKDIP